MQKQLRITKGNNSIKELAPSPYIFIISICLVYMNEFARLMKFHQGLFKVLRKQNLTDRHRMDGQHENSIPAHRCVCVGGGGGYNKYPHSILLKTDSEYMRLFMSTHILCFNGALLTAYLYVAMYHCYHTKKERTDPGLLLGPS